LKRDVEATNKKRKFVQMQEGERIYKLHERMMSVFGKNETLEKEIKGLEEEVAELEAVA